MERLIRNENLNWSKYLNNDIEKCIYSIQVADKLLWILFNFYKPIGGTQVGYISFWVTLILLL